MPQLPRWTDAQSVSAYATSVLAFLLSLATAFHPGFREPAMVQALIPAVGIIVAGIAQAVNVTTHRAAHAKAVTVPVAGPKGDPGPAGKDSTLDVAEFERRITADVIRRFAAMSAGGTA